MHCRLQDERRTGERTPHEISVETLGDTLETFYVRARDEGRCTGRYEKNSPGEWEKLKISDNDVFRAGLDKAVRRFQAWAALTVDGEVGPQVCVRTRGYTNMDFIVL